MKIEELKILIAVAESGSFAGAADKLNVAPSAISRGIKNLERQLNTTLFNRTTRKNLITSEGLWLLERARETITNIGEIRSHFTDESVEPEGRLTIDAATPFALHFIAPMISTFTQRYPKIEIVLESNEAVTDLIAQKVDIAIRVGPLKDSTLKAKKIGDSHRGLYASPAYVDQYGYPSSVDELNEHKCLGFTEPASLNIWPIKSKGGQLYEAMPCMLSNSGETLKQLAILGNGIICVSKFTVQKELRSGELVPILTRQIEQKSIPIYAVFYSQQNVGNHIRMFIDFLEEYKFEWSG